MTLASGATVSSVHFDSEDELPEDLKVREYYSMLTASQLGEDGQGGVRLFPYVKINGKKYYLIEVKS